MKKMIIKIGLASCGIAAGAEELLEVAQEILRDKQIDGEIIKVGCLGMCYAEPMVEIDGVIYGNVTKEKLHEIVGTGHALSTDSPLHPSPLDLQPHRIVLRNCGIIDPQSIDDYIAHDGYKALEKALKENNPEKIIQDITASGLRGRGGGGFPTGLKWKLTRDNIKIKSAGVIICNADEGDPGAFMDRSVLESDPHSVIEGMIIAAFAVGANSGYIYIRAEYPLAIKHLKIAIEKAYQNNFLGKNILGSDFSFDLQIKEGAGAFVCGEETALIASIEGKRGMPSIRPPYPAESGLYKKPTNINNVETFANVPYIIYHGYEDFAKLGTEKSKGTKVFALAGKIKKSGLIEVPMGISIRDIIFKIGGGMKTDSPFKAVQLGGPSGGCIPESLLDTPVDYDSLTQTGAIMGSGGMVVMDTDTCMVDVAKYFLSFTQKESCGKCTCCRIGTRRMLEILTRITEGKGKLEDIDLLKELAINISQSSLCGLGQTAPNPVLTTLKYFQHEYEAHIKEKKCPAGVCKALITFEILQDKCIGCTLCAKACPVKCISGEVKQPHKIDQTKCVKCGICYRTCKFNAIINN